MSELFNYIMNTPSNTNPAVLSTEISKNLVENLPQSDYEQNDETQKDYIKNRPFWSTKTTRLRNTYEDWKAMSHDSVSFVVEGKFYADIKPHIYDSGYVFVYNLPTDDNTIYQVTSRVGPTEFYVVCCRKEDDTEVENWSLYPPEESEEIQYLDPKYIENMYYTEEAWSNTTEDLVSLVGKWTTVVEGKELTIKYNGVIYENVAPYYSDHYLVYDVNLDDGTNERVFWWGEGGGLCTEGDATFRKETVHRIPPEYCLAVSPIFLSYNKGKGVLSIGYDEIYDIMEHGGYVTLTDGEYNYSLVYVEKIDECYTLTFRSHAYEWGFDSNGVGIVDYILYIHAYENGEGSIEWDEGGSTPVGIVYPDGYETPFSSLTLKSSTADSTKKFKITVDDTGTLTATEITETT